MAGHMSHKYNNSAYSKTIDDNDDQSDRGEGLEGVYESVSDKQEKDGADHVYAVPGRRRQDKEWHDVLHTGSRAKTSQLDVHIEKPSSAAACSGKSHYALVGALTILVIGLTAVVGYLVNEQVNLTSKMENHFKETSETLRSYQEKLKDYTEAERLNMTLTTLGSNYKKELDAVVAAVALLNQNTQDSVTQLNQTIKIEVSEQDLTHKRLLNKSLSQVEQCCDSKLSMSQQSTASEINFVNQSVFALEQTVRASLTALTQSLSSETSRLNQSISAVNSVVAGLGQQLSTLDRLTPRQNCYRCTSSHPCPISTLFIEDCHYGSITTDGYPNDYANYIDKKWALINQGYTNLTLNLLDFKLEYGCCGCDFLQVNQEAMLCETKSANTIVRYDVRNAQVVTMYFHTDVNNRNRGFKLSFSFS